MVVYLFNFNTCQDLALLEIGDQAVFAAVCLWPEYS